MLSRRVLARVLGVDARQVRLLGVEEVADGLEVVVRPRARWAHRCPHCQRRCPGYDRGRWRRWRSLDAGRVRVFVTARTPRVRCSRHGVVVAAVPWARHVARHTVAFEQAAAWCAVQMSATATSQLLRCSWRSVGAIIVRVAADLAEARDGDGLDGLRHIGIDEVSYRRRHHYLVVVVDHQRHRLVWAAPGRSTKTVIAFFDALGPQRTKALTHISADGARWISDAVEDRAEHVVQCLDPFHLVSWANEAMDQVRREIWHEVRRAEAADGRRGGKRATPAVARLQKTRWALWTGAGKRTDQHREQLTWIAATHPRLHRAWRIKEALRAVLTLTGQPALDALDAWLNWARRSRLKPFVELARRVTRFYEQIAATLNCRITNALSESMNAKIRLITRRAYGFHNIDSLIALAFLTLSGQRPQLPT